MLGRISGSTPLRVEQLERRDVPSVTVALQGSTLVIKGDGANDTVIVTEAGGQLLINANGQMTTMPRAAVGLISFDGGAGNDVFVNGTSVAAVAMGGSGD